MHFDVFSSSSSSSKTYLKTVNIRDVPDPDISIRYPVKFRYPVVSGKILPDNISVFEIGETGVKTLERELKSYLTGLTS